MKRYFLYLAYDGTAYCGWQIQPNGLAVQEVVEKALSTLLRESTTVVGAGRTDAGVHARCMVAHFDAENIADLAELVKRLNSILPQNIAVHKVIEVPSDAHARFDATTRLYRYYVTTKKDPFSHQLKYRVSHDLDVEAMNLCANTLLEYEDFTSFSKLHTDVKTNNCSISHAQWKIDDDGYVFTIKSNRFLRNMVRSIVGTLLEAGRGRLDAEGMRKIIESRDRGKAGDSAPGHALFLEQVEYDNIIIKNNK